MDQKFWVNHSIQNTHNPKETKHIKLYINRIYTHTLAHYHKKKKMKHMHTALHFNFSVLISVSPFSQLKGQSKYCTAKKKICGE